jgi:hypothetical protein
MFAIRCYLPALLAGLAIILSTAVVAGPDDETATIEGKLNLNGKPVAKGKVSFHPPKGKPIEATIKDGAYSADKVPVGEMIITVKAKGIPEKYADPKTSPLRYDAKKGRNELDLVLTP